MNIRHACWLSLLIAATATAQQRLSTTITAVTVYSDRAEITRTGEASLVGGEYEFVIKDLPVGMQDQSVRIGGAGTAGARITDIKIETEYLDTVPKNRLTELQEQLTLLVQEEKIYTDRISLLGKEKDLLDQIRNSAVQQNQSKDTPRVSIEDWTKLFAFYDANYEKVNGEIRTLDKKKSELQQKKTQLQNQINQLSGYGKLSRKQVVLAVSVSRAGSMKFDLNYVITGAKWYPVYDVRVSPDDKSVEMVYYAMIAQNTGEDWKNVQMSISTARPNVSGAIPQLAAWYLKVYEPYYGGLDDMSAMSGAGMSMAKRAEKPKKDYMEIEEEAGELPVVPLEIDEAIVETKTTAVVFTIPKKTTVPSDKFDHKVMITTEALKADFAYSAVPKLSGFAFLRGRVENTTEAPFLAGAINVFFGNSFVGTSRIATVIPTETFDVSLGVDEGIKVKREQVKDFRAEKGLFSKNTRKTFEYKITIESYKKTEDTISVVDQFPISSDERIKVEAMLPEFEKEKYSAVHPNGVIIKREGGIVEWRLRIRPKEKIELRIKYAVEYPKELQVEGL